MLDAWVLKFGVDKYECATSVKAYLIFLQMQNKPIGLMRDLYLAFLSLTTANEPLELGM
jgi:hypothetical protein